MSGARTADRPMRFSARPERVERAGAAVRVEFDAAHRPPPRTDFRYDRLVAGSKRKP